LIQCLQDHRLLETIQEYSRVCYVKETRGYQPLTERVLTDAIGCLEDSLKDTEKLLNEEREARRLADDRLANAELLVKFMHGGTTSEGVHGVKRPRERSPR
jgi:hypothetical protein